MIWRNPLAWLGIATVAIPILVHLIGRRKPRLLPFPTLRFVNIAPTLPSRRHRLTDLPLLAVRIAMIAAAVAALAQPWWPRPAARTSGVIARALVVDSSVSMTRLVGPGRTALEEGRALAAAATTGASVTRLIEAGALQTALPAALGWLATQPGTHEIVAFSDFQRGALDDADIAAVPAHVGLTLMLIPIRPATIGSATGRDASGKQVLGRVTLTADATAVNWQPLGEPEAPSSISILSAPADAARVEAAIAAAKADAPPPAAFEDRNIQIAFPGAANEIGLWQSAKAIDARWMFDVVAAVRADATLSRLAGAEPAVTGPPTAPGSVSVIFEDASGKPRLVAGAAHRAGNVTLMFFSLTAPGDLFSAALVRAVARASAANVPAGEQEPETIAADQLLRWSRPASPAPIGSGGATDSDGRWVWVIVLLLLFVETWMRRRTIPAAPATTEVPRARVA